MHIGLLIPYPPSYSETFIQRRIDVIADSYRSTSEHTLFRLAQKGFPFNTPFVLYTKAQDTLRKNFGIFWHPLERRAIRAYIRTKQPDVILADYGKVGVQAYKLCEEYDIPLVVHFHGYDAFRESTLREYDTAHKKMFRSAYALVALSRPMQKQLVKLGAPEGKTHYIPNGLQLSAFAPITPSTNPPRLLAVGRFVEKKSPENTIRAFARVARDFPESQLVMIGDGPRKTASKEIARELNIANRVAFLGKQSHATVKQEMQRSRAFVQHSVRARSGDSEGMPNAVLEASATGLPVIATRHAAIPDIVKDGETGLLFDEGDIAGMADAMQNILSDPAYGDTLGAAGRKRVEEHFDINETAEQLRDLLRAAARS